MGGAHTALAPVCRPSPNTRSCAQRGVCSAVWSVHTAGGSKGMVTHRVSRGRELRNGRRRWALAGPHELGETGCACGGMERLPVGAEPVSLVLETRLRDWPSLPSLSKPHWHSENSCLGIQMVPGSQGTPGHKVVPAGHQRVQIASRQVPTAHWLWSQVGSPWAENNIIQKRKDQNLDPGFGFVSGLGSKVHFSGQGDRATVTGDTGGRRQAGWSVFAKREGGLVALEALVAPSEERGCQVKGVGPRNASGVTTPHRVGDLPLLWPWFSGEEREWIERVQPLPHRAPRALCPLRRRKPPLSTPPPAVCVESLPGPPGLRRPHPPSVEVLGSSSRPAPASALLLPILVKKQQAHRA